MTNTTTTLRAYQVFLKTGYQTDRYGVVADNSADACTLLAQAIGHRLTADEKLLEGNGPIDDRIAKLAGIDLTKLGDYQRLDLA